MTDPRPTINEGAHDEEALLRRVARADGPAFETLYDRYARSVYSLALRLVRDAQTAQEITQDVFMDIWRSAREFDATRGRARAWILSMAHHKAVDALRRLRVRASEPLIEGIPAEADVAARALAGVEGARVRKALDDLPLGQRETIVLAYYGGYTQQEIATRLGVPLGTVKTRTRDALLRLRRMLLGMGADEEVPQ